VPQPLPLINPGFFQPKIESFTKSHPLVFWLFTADFDGDQNGCACSFGFMRQFWAQVLMLSLHNILNPQNGNSITLLHKTWYWGL